MTKNAADKTELEYIRMTQAPVFGLVFKLSLPTTFTMLITSIYNLADTFFVSSLGNAATGAVGVVFAIQSIIQAVGYGFGMGTQSLISRKLGEKKYDEANMYGTSGFLASILVGALMLFGLVDLKGMMHVFGATSAALPLACDYGFWILLAAPIFCSSFVLNNILRAEGRATLSMVGLCSGGVLNIGLDALFIFKLNMGVEGAAIATVTSQAVSFLILLSYFVFNKSIVKINPLKTSRHLKDYLNIFRVGLPTVFRQSLGSVATTLLNIAVRPYGDAAMSAVSIANKIYMLLRSMLIGMGQGFQPVAGYNYGAKRYDRVRSSFDSAIIMGTVYGVVAALLLFFLSGHIMALFRPGDEEVIAIGSKMLRYLSFSLPVLGYSTFVNQLYQSLGFVIPATILASCRQGIFFIPLILILPKFLGVGGIQMTQMLADLITFVISIPFHIYIFKKRIPRYDGRDDDSQKPQTADGAPPNNDELPPPLTEDAPSKNDELPTSQQQSETPNDAPSPSQFQEEATQDDFIQNSQICGDNVCKTATLNAEIAISCEKSLSSAPTCPQCQNPASAPTCLLCKNTSSVPVTVQADSVCDEDINLRNDSADKEHMNVQTESADKNFVNIQVDGDNREE